MKSLLILIAGPVRSGTHNRAELIDANLNNMAQVALRVYQKGHIPVVGEWLACPSPKLRVQRKLAMRLARNISTRSLTVSLAAATLYCACRANPGERTWILRRAKKGLSIYYSLEEIPDR
jgi:hypothetical protein